MSRDETHDAACTWAFRKTFRRSPTPDELRDYKLTLDERDQLGLYDALPIFTQLRQSRGTVAPVPAAPKARAPRRRLAKATERVPRRRSQTNSAAAAAIAGVADSGCEQVFVVKKQENARQTDYLTRGTLVPVSHQAKPTETWKSEAKLTDTAAPQPEKTDTILPPLKSGCCGNPEAPSRKRRGRPPTSERARARALLRKQLADGPKPGALVEAAAAEAAIRKPALLAATDVLGVRTQRGQWWLPG